MGTRVNGVSLDGGTTLSTATPQPPGTAAAGSTGEASDAGHVHDRELPDPTGAPDGQVPTTTGGVYGLAAPAGGVDTSLQSAPDTGWTAASGAGVGTASITGGVVTQTVTSAQSIAVLRRTMNCSPALPAIELSARVTVTTVPVSGAYYAAIAIVNSSLPNDAGSARGIAVFVNPPNAIANVNTGGAWSQPANASLPATLTSGTLWLRIVYGAGYVSWYAGTGATRPTSWTRIYTAASPDLTWQSVDQVAVYAERAGGGSGDYVVQWSDIQWRSLLGAPT
jgi:hypothetical protein